MAVTKRYCIDDAVVNYNYREGLFEDSIRIKTFNKVFESIDTKGILCKIIDLKKVGKDTSCDTEFLFYLKMLADYFEVIKEETTCGSLKGFDELKTEYKLDCIKNILTCNYGLGNLVDELIDLLALRTPYNGISYMTINLDDCELFTVHGK